MRTPRFRLSLISSFPGLLHYCVRDAWLHSSFISAFLFSCFPCFLLYGFLLSRFPSHVVLLSYFPVFLFSCVRVFVFPCFFAFPFAICSVFMLPGYITASFEPSCFPVFSVPGLIAVLFYCVPCLVFLVVLYSCVPVLLLSCFRVSLFSSFLVFLLSWFRASWLHYGSMSFSCFPSFLIERFPVFRCSFSSSLVCRCSCCLLFVLSCFLVLLLSRLPAFLCSCFLAPLWLQYGVPVFLVLDCVLSFFCFPVLLDFQI